MPTAQKVHDSPGVYQRKVFLRPTPVLETAVPGFVGFASPPGNGSNFKFNHPVQLTRKDQFNVAFGPDAGDAGSQRYLADAVAGFFDNGGVRCYVVPVDSSRDLAEGLINAVAALAPLDD